MFAAHPAVTLAAHFMADASGYATTPAGAVNSFLSAVVIALVLFNGRQFSVKQNDVIRKIDAADVRLQKVETAVAVLNDRNDRKDGPEEMVQTHEWKGWRR